MAAERRPTGAPATAPSAARRRGGRAAGALVVAAAVLAGCAAPAATGSAAPSGAGAASVVPVIVSAQQAVGRNRFLFSFLDPERGLPVADERRTVSVAFIAPGETQPGPAAPATFVWAIEGSRGDYVLPAEFPTAGRWKAVFVVTLGDAPAEAIAVEFDVAAEASAVAIGERAPATRTPTLAEVGGELARITTDPRPEPAFYERSVADALAAGIPFVLVFATPAFCQSAQCGPTLDVVKRVVAAAPGAVTVINVEPYRLAFTEGRLQPVLDADGRLQPVEAVEAWGILSEPWIFTVDADGIVRGSFEGVVSDEELAAAIEEIAAP